MVGHALVADPAWVHGGPWVRLQVLPLVAYGAALTRCGALQGRQQGAAGRAGGHTRPLLQAGSSSLQRQQRHKDSQDMDIQQEFAVQVCQQGAAGGGGAGGHTRPQLQAGSSSLRRQQRIDRCTACSYNISRCLRHKRQQGAAGRCACSCGCFKTQAVSLFPWPERASIMREPGLMRTKPLC
jgi:hypothetical protein